MVSGACSEHAMRVRAFASRFIEPSAKQSMLYVAAAHEVLAILKISLEHDLELRNLSPMCKL